MKAKVRLNDSYSGRGINIITTLVEDDFRRDVYNFDFSTLSNGQRKKIENFFGKKAAYYTKPEIIKIY